jgi:hypothetical protein
MKVCSTELSSPDGAGLPPVLRADGAGETQTEEEDDKGGEERLGVLMAETVRRAGGVLKDGLAAVERGLRTGDDVVEDEEEAVAVERRCGVTVFSASFTTVFLGVLGWDWRVEEEAVGLDEAAVTGAGR